MFTLWTFSRQFLLAVVFLLEYVFERKEKLDFCTKKVYKEQLFMVFLIPLERRKKFSLNFRRYQCENLRALFPAVVFSRSETLSVVVATDMQAFLVSKLYSSSSQNREDMKQPANCVYFALCLRSTGQVTNNNIKKICRQSIIHFDADLISVTEIKTVWFS